MCGPTTHIMYNSLYFSAPWVWFQQNPASSAPPLPNQTLKLDPSFFLFTHPGTGLNTSSFLFILLYQL